MAVDLRSINEFPYMKSISIDTSTTMIRLPSEARTIKIGSEASILYIAQNGATDGGVIPTDRMFVPSNNVIEIKLGIGMQRKNIFVAAKTGTGTAVIMLEEQ
jgi:hypothetical protein